MSKTLLCDDNEHLFHKWSKWEIAEGIFSRGILYGRKAGEEFTRQLRARQCEWCKQIDWREL